MSRRRDAGRGVDRRAFLGAAAAAGALAGCDGLDGPWPLPYAVPKGPVPGSEGWRPGEERWVRSVCLQCPGGCGIRVRVVEGRAVKIEGNPDHPLNAGRLCPKGQNGLQVLYDPDRIQEPLRRVGPRGTGRFEPVPWEEAIREVGKRLREIREAGTPERLAVLSGRVRGHMEDLLDRFLAAYGSPNGIDGASVGSDSTPVALQLQQGVRAYPAFDWTGTNYVLSFGASLMEAFRPTVYLLRAYSALRRGTPGARTKFVQVDPRFSVTAAKADEWIPVAPGTDAALALSIGHVLVRDGLFDRAFVEESTFGFEDWTDPHGVAHRGFRSLLLGEYPPAAAAGITGVPAETIERIAHEMAAHRPAIAVAERGVGMQTGGVYARMAVHSLNALLGSIDRPGGILVQEDPPFLEWPPFEPDATARRGLARPRLDGAGTAAAPLARSVALALPGAVLSGEPYPVEALLVYYANPVYSRPSPERTREALRRIPLVVSFSPFLDETTACADWVLPDHTYLERFGDDAVVPSVGYPVLGLRQPVVAPLHDTRDAGDVLLAIAKEVGGATAAAFPFPSYADMVRHALRGVQEAGRGTLREGSPESFEKRLRATGVWADPPYRFGRRDRVFRTPSGRFEFYSRTLRERLLAVAPEGGAPGPGGEEARIDRLLAGMGIEARGDRAFLPHFEPARLAGDPSEYPFVLNVYKAMTHAEGRGANQPHLREAAGHDAARAWPGWVEVNPDAADELGIRDGTPVWVESPVGRVRVLARLNPGAMPGVVHMPHGFGHSSGGRFSGGGANPNEILAEAREPLAGLAAWLSTRVRLVPA